MNELSARAREVLLAIRKATAETKLSGSIEEMQEQLNVAYSQIIEQALLAERRLALESGPIYDKYNTPAMKALHDLTPGGSEFAGDPKYCADYIRKREHSQHEMIVKLALQVRELEKQVSELDGKALRAAAEKEVGDPQRPSSCHLTNGDFGKDG